MEAPCVSGLLSVIFTAANILRSDRSQNHTSTFLCLMFWITLATAFPRPRLMSISFGKSSRGGELKSEPRATRQPPEPPVASCSRLTAPEVSASVGLRDHVRPVIDKTTLCDRIRPVSDRVAGKSAPPLVQAQTLQRSIESPAVRDTHASVDSAVPLLF